MAFNLSSSDSNLNSRIDSVFGSLDSISNTLHSNSIPAESQSIKRKRIDDSDFKTPHLRTKFKRHLPGYLINPEKWKKYSMKDVKCSSDSDNKKIGLELMEKLKKASKSKDLDDSLSSDGKIVFKKPIKVADNDEEIHDATKSESSNMVGFVLPEYEVGKRKTKKNKNLIPNNPDNVKPSQITLSHLDFQDDELE